MSHPDYRPLNLGDVNDDDGTVIDSLLIEVDTAPTVPAEPFAVPMPELQQAKPCTRLLSDDLLVRIAWPDPTPVLYRDATRTDLQIAVTSSDAVPSAVTDFVWVSDESGKPSGRIRHGETLSLQDHTGPVFISASAVGSKPASRADMYVSYWATVS